MDPPDSLLRQFEVYLEERSEDYIEHKERMLHHLVEGSVIFYRYYRIWCFMLDAQ